MTDVNKLIKEGKSLDYVLEAVKAEYAAKAMREAEKEREAKAKALKIEASRKNVIKTINDYLVTLVGDPAVLDFMKPFEKELEELLCSLEKDAETLLAVKQGGCKGDCRCKDKTDEDVEVNDIVNMIMAMFEPEVPKEELLVRTPKKKNDDDIIQSFLNEICK